MARIPYADPSADPEVAVAADRVRQERDGQLIHLYQMLLHSPPVALGWLQLGGALRYEGTLDGLVRELAIVRVALLTEAEYELVAHRRYARAQGATEEQLVALADWEAADVFPAPVRAALALVDETTRHVRVADTTFAALRAHFDDRQLLELVVNVGFYQMVSRVLEIMQVDPERP